MLNSPIGTGADVFLTIVIILLAFGAGLTAVDYYQKKRKTGKSESEK